MRITHLGSHQNRSRAIRRAFKADSIPELYEVQIPVRHERAKPVPTIATITVHVMLPSDFLYWAWTVHNAQFLDRVLGGQESLVNFWKKIKRHDPLWGHPGLADRTKLHLCLPLGVHGDGVPFKKQGAGSTSLQTISLGSYTGNGPTSDTHFLYSGIPGDILVKRDAGRGNTTMEPLWRAMVWDLEACQSGIRPACDEFGVPWLPGHPRALLAGQDICGGYRAIHIQNRGDLDWHCNETRLQHWMCAEPCFCCRVPKASMFDWDAHYEDRDFPEHPLFEAPWIANRRTHVVIDPAHTLDKGVSEHVLGNLFKNLVYERQMAAGDMSCNLKVVNIMLQGYYDERKIKSRVRSILLKDTCRLVLLPTLVHMYTLCVFPHTLVLVEVRVEYPDLGVSRVRPPRLKQTMCGTLRPQLRVKGEWSPDGVKKSAGTTHLSPQSGSAAPSPHPG